MSSEPSFQIALPSLDDDADDSEQLFSYPAPRFGQSGSLSPFGPFGGGGDGFGGGGSGSGGFGPSSYMGGNQSEPSSSVRKDSTVSAQSPISSARATAGPPTVGSRKHSNSVGSDTLPPPPPLKQIVKKSSFGALRSTFGGKKESATSSLGMHKSPSVGGLGNSSALPDSSAGSNYPVLRNPFSRSASASATTMHTMNNNPITSPNSFASSYNVNKTRKARNGSVALSSSSINFHQSRPSTTSSGFSANHSPNSTPPPPLPTSLRLPQKHRRTPSSLSITTNSFVPPSQMSLPPPSTPPQFALHLLLRLFQEVTTSHLDGLVNANRWPLGKPMPIIEEIVGKGKDSELDKALESLGIAVAISGNGGSGLGKVLGSSGSRGRGGPGGMGAAWGGGDAKVALDCLIKWRNNVLEDEVGRGAVRSHLPGMSTSGVSDAAAMLNERINLGTMYILLRALLSIIRHTPSKEVLGEALGTKIEDMLWRWIVKEKDMESLSRSPNKLANQRLLVELLGALANIRFLTLTDRFVVELGKGLSVGSGAVGGTASKIEKEAEGKFELIVRAMKCFKLKVYPPQDFDMCADFLCDLAGFFSQTHGAILKTAYAETLQELIHPIANVATAEVNHPTWAKAINIIRAQAARMASKDKYWTVSFPLVVTALCVSTREVFLEQWQSCLNIAVGKMKDRIARPIIINSIMRLLWVYLNRCSGESSSVVTASLDTVFKFCFPPSNQPTLQPSEVPIDVFICILHFTLLRQSDYGQDFVFQLLAESRLSDGGSSSKVGDGVLMPERMAIAIRAVLLHLYCLEHDVKTPVFPSTCSFSSFAYSKDYDFSGEALSETVLTKPEVTAFLDRLSPLIGSIALLADGEVGKMSLFDDQFHAFRFKSAEGFDSFTVQHGLIKLSYKKSLKPIFELLRAAFDAWPRCSHLFIGTDTALKILCRGIAHVDPGVAFSATGALKRIAQSKGVAETAALTLSRYLTTGDNVVRASQIGSRAYEQQIDRLLRLWVDILSFWVSDLHGTPQQNRVAVDSQVLAEIECSALFFLSSTCRSLRVLSISALRRISEIQDLSSSDGQSVIRAINLFETEGKNHDVLTTTMSNSSFPTPSDQARLASFKDPTPPDVLIKWAESDNNTDQQFWFLYYPHLIKHLYEQVPSSLLILRTLVGRVFLNWRSIISTINGQAKSSLAAAPNSGFRSNLPLTTKGVSDYYHLAEQWKIFLTILCATTVSGDGSSSALTLSVAEGTMNRDAESERLASSKVLFQQVISYLGSESHRFRDAAVIALGHIPQPSLADLLGSLQSVTRHVYDNAQPNGRSTPARRASESENSSRTYTSVAHVFARISHLIKDPRSLGDVKLMLAMLEFVRRTHRYLLVREDNWNLHPLRRYFCAVVENLTDGLATLDDSSRFFPSELRAAVFKICDEWCNLGRRADIAQARESRVLVAIHGSLTSSDRDKGAILSTMSNQTKLLSSAAATAMAALCQGSLFPVTDLTDSSRTNMEIPLEPNDILQWIRGLFSTPSSVTHEVGRKALRSLIRHNHEHSSFMTEVLHQCCSEGDQFGLHQSFFSVLVETLSFARPPALSFSQKACIALIKLGHPDVAIRRRAYNLVETLGNKDEHEFAWVQPSVGSSAPNIYLGAQRRIAEAFAECHPSEAPHMLIECTHRFSRVDSLRRPVCLAILPPFLKNLDLSASETISRPESIPSYILLSNLLFLAVKFGDSHPSEVRDIWINLACGPLPHNSSCIIKFLFQQSGRRPTQEFLVQAQRIVACLAQTPIAQAVYEDLASFIEPAAMVSLPEADEAWPVPSNLFVPDLNALFPTSVPIPALSTGQLALLFVGEVMLERFKESSLDPRLAVLLHATCVQVDHHSSQVREQAQALLFQILYAWTCDSVHLEDENVRTIAWDKIGRLWDERSELFWTQGDEDVYNESLHVPKRMETLVERVLRVLEPYYPELRHVWGALAVDWGTACPDRHIACRSFQIFRVLSPEVSAQMLADMLGRLSNTLADVLPNNNLFCREIILSLSEIVRSMETDDLLSFPQLFWCVAACLSTTVESEFLVSLELLNLILEKLDLCEDDNVDVLLQNQPDDWPGDDLKLQAILLPGLRSSLTDQMTFDVLARLAKVHCPLLLDIDADRTLHIFTAILPWCLHGMDQDALEPSLVGLADDISAIAEQEGKVSIQRLMTSFSKNRFRTKDDFLRQAVGCLREHFLPTNGFRVIEVLLGLCLNSRDWIREKTMLILKLVFQSSEAKEPLAIYGAELLMPLLRLLSTEFAASALEVLSEPINVQGGPAAAQVIRMSMTFGAVMDGLTDPAGEVFGTPLETGWCVPKAEEQSRLARASMLAVFGSLTVSGNVQSQAHFSMFAEPNTLFGINGSQLSLESYGGSIAEELTLGQLVGDLHSLNQFFDDEQDDEFTV
ncbi:Fry-like conserved proteins [Phaffia rhodozyma]|uniref:Fry-like conserved proteins n=1 Tax=Phaffia rhodozyma TaxID=264483 RepID=A0A0F7SK70_PHARH|nr:Fry-like conserved proteins [Phaffia rhodozyma]